RCFVALLAIPGVSRRRAPCLARSRSGGSKGTEERPANVASGCRRAGSVAEVFRPASRCHRIVSSASCFRSLLLRRYDAGSGEVPSRAVPPGSSWTLPGKPVPTHRGRSRMIRTPDRGVAPVGTPPKSLWFLPLRGGGGGNRRSQYTHPDPGAGHGK